MDTSPATGGAPYAAYVKYGTLSAIVALVGYASAKLIFKCVHALDKDEQLYVQRLTSTEVINGPGLFFISP